MESSFLLMIAYDMLLSVPSIKTISRSLTLVILQISALHGFHACRQNASRTPAHLG